MVKLWVARLYHEHVVWSCINTLIVGISLYCSHTDIEHLLSMNEGSHAVTAEHVKTGCHYVTVSASLSNTVIASYVP